LADYKNKSRYQFLKLVRFVVGGAIDFFSIYKIKSSSKSPATHFCKTQPYQFLLTQQETSDLVIECFPELSKSPHLVDLVADWSGGYIHYIFTFSKWLLSEVKRLGSPSLQELVAQLKYCIQENDRIPMYKYCYLNWSNLENDDDLITLLRIVLTVGYVSDHSEKSRKLAEYGFLVERPGVPGIFVLSNTLVGFFVRERLAEKNLVLSLDESINFLIPSMNSKAHLLILQIESKLILKP